MKRSPRFWTTDLNSPPEESSRQVCFSYEKVSFSRGIARQWLELHIQEFVVSLRVLREIAYDLSVPMRPRWTGKRLYPPKGTLVGHRGTSWVESVPVGEVTFRFELDTPTDAFPDPAWMVATSLLFGDFSSAAEGRYADTLLWYLLTERPFGRARRLVRKFDPTLLASYDDLKKRQREQRRKKGTG